MTAERKTPIVMNADLLRRELPEIGEEVERSAAERSAAMAPKIVAMKSAMNERFASVSKISLKMRAERELALRRRRLQVGNARMRAEGRDQDRQRRSTRRR